MQPNLPEHEVVLLGVGHTNAHVLRMWRMEPIHGARLTCVSNYPTATYSGMLPGVLAGQYPPEAMEIDLVRCCAAAGARLILGNTIGLDRQRRELLFDDRPPLPFDVLSIGIGSVPSREGLQSADDTLLPIKPMQSFLSRLADRIQAWASEGRQSARHDPSPLHIVIAGGGVGGIEIAFCLPRRLEAVLARNSPRWRLAIVEAGPRLGGGLSQATASEVAKLLATRGVQVLLSRRVTHVANGQAWLDDGSPIPANIVLWATSAAPPPLLSALDLPKDERGFLLTEPTLECLPGERIFAVGDTGTVRASSIAKAGVYAVREGPILWENIGSTMRGHRLRTYAPQKRFLKLINTGDGSAIGEYLGGTLRGTAMWWLKDRIDRKFVAMYQDYSPARMADHEEPNNAAQPRCAGCGGKVGGSVLARALARLDIPQHEIVAVGLAQPDDVALLTPAAGKQVAATTDFFAAPFDDPYLVGRMAAIHASADVLAKGAAPVAALAIATIPSGSQRQQEHLLYELLAGGLHELKQMGATLAGGHTIEGPQLAIGYTILAEQRGTFRHKGGLRPGDALVLTRRLGTGVLLAAHMQARLRAAWWKPLVESMLRTSTPAAAICDEFQVRAATDISGFGLAGHLLEMLRASGCAANLVLDAIPLLPGVAELFAERLESTLAPANRDVQGEIEAEEATRRDHRYAALFDPQTCGGLLVGVASDRAREFCDRLQAAGDKDASIIGRVIDCGSPRYRLSVMGSWGR